MVEQWNSYLTLRILRCGFIALLMCASQGRASKSDVRREQGYVVESSWAMHLTTALAVGWLTHFLLVLRVACMCMWRAVTEGTPTLPQNAFPFAPPPPPPLHNHHLICLYSVNSRGLTT